MERLNQDLNIFVVTHKVFRLPQGIDGQIYTPIQVGTCADLGYLSENQRDNIAHKNANYCELTALYFMWKNVRCRYAGLVHYRRYLGSKADDTLVVGRAEIEQILQDYDMILPEKHQFPFTIQEQYAKHHYAQDWEILRQVIAERHADYLAAFEQVSGDKWMHYANICISRKPLLDEYCAWLFDILFVLEARLDISGYDAFQARIFGFLSERLFNVWLVKNAGRLRCYQLPQLRARIGVKKLSQCHRMVLKKGK